MYIPCLLIKSECLPIWTIFPFSMTIILSADIIVESLWAIMMLVLSFINFCKSFCISCSVWESSDDVASSKTKIFLFAKIALAIDTLCFSPPDNFTPLSPTIVFSLLGRLFTNLSNWANLIALKTSSFLAVGFENKMLLYIVSSNRMHSWGTMLNSERSDSCLKSLMLLSSIRISPESGSYNL